MASKQRIEDRRRTAIDLIFQGHKPSAICRYLGVTSDTLYKDLTEIRQKMVTEEDYEFTPDWRLHRKQAVMGVIRLLHNLGYGDRRIAEVLQLSSSHVYRLRLCNDWSARSGIVIQTHKEMSDEGGRLVRVSEYQALPLNDKHILLMPGSHTVRYDVIGDRWNLVRPFLTDISRVAA